ncbi:MAG: 2-dehydropantoate 2-reductase [Pseudomonadota bacterium]
MITILGAGSIGCYVGGVLAAAGHPITLIGRAAMADALTGGFHITTMDGTKHHAQPAITTDPRVLSDATTILLCVKSADTGTAAQMIQDHAPPQAQVVSLQNGVSNPDALADTLGAERVTAGMVGFNVIRQSKIDFVQTTDGEIILDHSGQGVANLFDGTAITAFTHRNMQGIQWTKLLMNLNNALNALSGMGLRPQLEDRDWRRVLAACIAEGLAVARAEEVQLEKLGKIHPRLLPTLLRLPDFIFLRVAQSMLRISQTARSSMADDYAQYRQSEVAWLNGHVVQRAQMHGLTAPVNARVVDAILRAFANNDRPPLKHPAKALLL